LPPVGPYFSDALTLKLYQCEAPGHLEKRNAQPFGTQKIPLNNMPFRYTKTFLLVLYVEPCLLILQLWV
jgi:hypothetical protein